MTKRGRQLGGQHLEPRQVGGELREAHVAGTLSAAKRRIADDAVGLDAVARLEALDRRIDIGIEGVGMPAAAPADRRQIARRWRSSRHRRVAHADAGASCRPAPSASRRGRRCRNIGRSPSGAAPTICGDKDRGRGADVGCADRGGVEAVGPFGAAALQHLGDRILGQGRRGGKPGAPMPRPQEPRRPTRNAVVRSGVVITMLNLMPSV